MSKVTAKKLWGESFHVVPEGLDEDEVVKYVDKLKVELDRQSALPEARRADGRRGGQARRQYKGTGTEGRRRGGRQDPGGRRG